MKKGFFYVLLLSLGFVAGFQVKEFFVKKVKPARKVKYWVAPMDPNYKRNKPGKSPMGMDLVPVFDDDSKENAGVSINPTVQNNISVKTQKAVKKNLTRVIETVGFVTVDEDKIDKVNTFADGWVRNLQVSSNGEQVNKGQLLFELFSPTIVNAQQEYLIAVKTSPSLVTPSIKKLKTLGLNDNQIRDLKIRGRATQTIKVFSNVDGVVQGLNIRDGMYVKPGTKIMSIEDLSTIWIEAEVYDKDISMLKLGQTAIARFNAYPDKEWMGQVSFIYPTLNKKSRTLKVRMTFPNPNYILKPNMFADISLVGKIIKNVIAIPVSSVIYADNMTRAILQLEDGSFIAKEIEIGLQTGDEIEVLQGIKTGDIIVTSSQFLIDSESDVQSSLKRITKPTKKETESHVVFGEGKILSIDKKKREIVLDHKPIKGFRMPSMIMRFKLSEDIKIENLKVNESIQFELHKLNSNDYVITVVRPLRERKGD